MFCQWTQNRPIWELSQSYSMQLFKRVNLFDRIFLLILKALVSWKFALMFLSLKFFNQTEPIIILIFRLLTLMKKCLYFIIRAGVAFLLKEWSNYLYTSSMELQMMIFEWVMVGKCLIKLFFYVLSSSIGVVVLTGVEQLFSMPLMKKILKVER